MPLSPKMKHELDQQYQDFQNQLAAEDKREKAEIAKEIHDETIEWHKAMQGEFNGWKEAWKHDAPHEYRFYASLWHFGHHATNAMDGALQSLNNGVEDALSALFEGLDHLI